MSNAMNKPDALCIVAHRAVVSILEGNCHRMDCMSYLIHEVGTMLSACLPDLGPLIQWTRGQLFVWSNNMYACRQPSGIV